MHDAGSADATKNMLKIVALCFVALVAVSEAGILDGMGDMGDFFSKFNDVRSLFANSESEMSKNVDRTKNLLTVIQEKASFLEPLASDSQRETIRKVKGFLGTINQFQARLRSNTGETFDQKKSMWENLVTSIFQDGGVMKLLPLLNSAPTTAATVLCLTLPILSYLFAN
ncbi:hypothetical protein L596_005143 [Steinernema carpocapsae]|uniref:SXP/RAL-2 family protein Ani s 5-like cation-binding domain-containing protein n=1 Tax=Steinernema carpocapsae TaxID=34508 RepID=A0A4U8UYB0_STECR|nr:hypothetical protein L596_005143 [Steinernema carpocapsae]